MRRAPIETPWGGAALASSLRPITDGSELAPASWRARVLVVAACAYLVLFALPLPWDVPLALLALAARAADGEAPRHLGANGKRMLVGLALFGLATIASTLAAADVRRSALAAMPLMPAALLFWIVSHRFTLGHLRALLLSLMALAALVAMTIVTTWLTDSSHDPHVWTRGVLRIVSVPNDTLIVAILSPVCLAVCANDRHLACRAGAVATLLLSVVAIVLAQSRLGLVAIVIAQVVSAVAMGRFRLQWLLAPLIAALAVDASSGFALLHKFADAQSESRIGLWWAAGAMFLDAPAFGHGPDTFGALRLPFVASFPATHAFGIEARYVPWPHNLYLEILAERGAIAFLAFAIALVAGWKAAAKLSHSRSNATRTVAAALVGALAAFAFAGFTELSMLHLWVPVIALTLLGTVAMLETCEGDDET